MTTRPPCRMCKEHNPATTGSATGYCVRCLEAQRYGDSSRLLDAQATKRERDQLLTACKAAVEFFRPRDTLPEDIKQHFRRIVEQDPILQQLRAAIANAERETDRKGAKHEQ